jgi:hypothetical protein
MAIQGTVNLEFPASKSAFQNYPRLQYCSILIRCIDESQVYLFCEFVIVSIESLAMTEIVGLELLAYKNAFQNCNWVQNCSLLIRCVNESSVFLFCDCYYCTA